MPLKVLPSITKPPGPLGVAGAEVDVGEPALAPARAPLDGEHDEVEGVDRLDLDPGRAAAPGGVGRREVLDHDALVAGGEHVGERTPRPPPASAVTSRGTRNAGGHQRLERRGALGAGRVEQVAAVEVQHVEEERRHPHRRAGSRPRRARRGLLERPRPAVVVEREHLAVEHERRRRAAASATSTTSGSRAVMSSSERVDHEHLVAARGAPGRGCRRAWCRPRRVAADLGQRLGHRRRRRGQHRQHRPHRPRARSRPAPPRRPRRPRARPRRSSPASIAARRTAASGSPARRGDRLLHQGVERALAHLAGDQAAQPRAARRRSPRANSSATAAARAACDPAPATRRDRARTPRRPRPPSATARRPGRAATRAPASRRRYAAGAARRRGRTPPPRPRRPGLARRPAQQVGDRGDLGLARAGGGDGRRRRDDIEKQHACIKHGRTPDRGASLIHSSR